MPASTPSHPADARPDPRSASSSKPTRSLDELDSAIVALSHRIAAGTYRLLVLVREFDDRLGWAKWGFGNGSEWLAWRCGLSLSAAREKLRSAHALRRLPAISTAFAEGRLSYTKVRALTRVAEPENEDLLLAYALNATAPQVEERCRQMRHVESGATESARRAWERRALTVLKNPSRGTLTLSLEVPIEDGELITQAIDRAVASGEADLGPEFAANGWQAQQADAVIAIARSYLGSGETSRPVAAADPYQVVVHVDAAALHGGAGRSDLPLETVRRLGCDGRLVTLVEDARGHPLALGRQQRTVSAALRRALYSRDRGCSFPGCHRKRFVDAHHIEHWAQGGETTLENLTLLCTQHHRLVHEGAFAIRRDAGGDLYFERPDGRVIPRGGYNPEDVVDDLVDVGNDGLAGSEFSRDEWLNRVVRSPKPSAEVREQAGAYVPDSSLIRSFDGRFRAGFPLRSPYARQAPAVYSAGRADARAGDRRERSRIQRR